jgi:outer membrane protein OmpA-like peptidoglycan-associated protein
MNMAGNKTSHLRKLAGTGLSALVVGTSLLSYSVVHADCNRCAKNRLDVLSEIENVKPSWGGAESSVWVNSNDPEPSVIVGDHLYFTMKSRQEAHFALVLVDSMGHTSVLKPDAVPGSGYDSASSYVVFPPLTESCFVYEPRSECFLKENSIVQGDTIGKETVFLLASQRPIDSSVFGLPSRSDYRSLGRDLDQIEQLVANLEQEVRQNKVDIYKYAYTVDSPDVQHTSRAIGRIVVDLEELASDKPAKKAEAEPVDNPVAVVETQPEKVIEPAAPALVFNNIRFGYDSAEITAEGRKELAALGSVLVDRLGEGKLPFVSLTGHTDSTGSAAYNMSLSGRRANSVKRYLVEQWGLPGAQIFADGAGESLPVATNDTAAGRSQNRRVEFTVISAAE